MLLLDLVRVQSYDAAIFYRIGVTMAVPSKQHGKMTLLKTFGLVILLGVVLTVVHYYWVK